MSIPSAQAAINRRCSPRRNPRQTVRIECRKGLLGLGRNVAETCLDISEGGLRFVATVPLVKEEQVEVLITGHGLGQIKRAALVRWCYPSSSNRHMIGAQFQSRLTFAEIQRLARP
jgi:hypothetical protein